MKNKIKELIKNKGLKTSKIIKETGLSKSYFYDVMNCNSVPSLAIARKISEVMGVAVDDLFPNEKLEEEAI
jgi:putative transcriptional regulator